MYDTVVGVSVVVIPLVPSSLCVVRHLAMHHTGMRHPSTVSGSVAVGDDVVLR